jgi:hypothetical protein
MQLTNTRTITSQTKLLTIVCNLALESSLPINTRTTPTTMLRVIVTGITQGLSATPKTHLDIRGNSPPHSAKGSLNPRPSMETKEAHIIPMHKINIDGAKTAILRIIIIIAERQSPATRCVRRALIAGLNVVVVIEISSPQRQRVGSDALLSIFYRSNQLRYCSLCLSWISVSVY